MSTETEPRLRILLVLSKLESNWQGGVGRVTTAMARELAQRGHEVHIAGRARDTGPPGPLPGVVLHPWAGSIPKALLLPSLLRLERTLRPHVVHFHSALPHGELMVPFRWALRRSDRPLLVATPHTGSRWGRLRRRAVRGMRAADVLVASCEWTRAHIRQSGIPEDRARVVASGIDSYRSHDPATEEPLILAMGRLVPQKGMDLLIEAFHRVAHSAPGWQLVIGGEGPELAGLRELADSRNAPVDLPGFLSGSAKAELLRRAAIGVVPSRSDMIPGVMLELQAHGLPVLAADTGGIAEAAERGRAALLIAADDVDALTKGLRTLIGDPELRSSLSAGALAASRSRLWPDLARKLEATYLDAIAREGTRPA